MRIKEEAIIVESVRYCVDLEYDGKIFYASAIYWINLQETSDWVVDSDDCDFDSLPLDYQNEVKKFAYDCWFDTEIFYNVNEVLKVKKH